MREQQESNTVLHGRWLFAARTAWVAVALLIVGLSIADAPGRYREMLTLCVGDECASEQLTPEISERFQSLGVSLGLYAGSSLALRLGFGLMTLLIAGTIFWRKSADPMGLLVAFTLALFAVTGEDGSVTAHPLVRSLLTTLSGMGFILFITLFFLFPDGRFVPRWTGPYLIAWAATTLGLVGILMPLYPALEKSLGLFYIVTFATPVFAQVYRYIRNPDPLKRQQTKWVVVGITGMAVGVLLTYGVFGEGSFLFHLLGFPIINVSLSLIPLSIAFSILRYRLWDIDMVINRALVYGVLTAALGSAYFGSIVLLQAAFRVLTGQESTLALVASTLAIAALFQPLRRRVQTTIDRRFYRRRYDAARTLASFGRTARDEVDLRRLTGALVGAVEKMVQPASVFLWLREPEHRR